MAKNYKTAYFCLFLLISFPFFFSSAFAQDYALKKLHVFKGIEDNVIVSQLMGKDADGNIFGFSTFREKFVIGNDSFSTTSSSNSDVLISRFTSAGEMSSNIQIDYSDYDKATDVAICTKNEIYVSGTFHSPFADSATILLKCDDKGKVLWKLKVSSAGCMGQGVCVDDEGNCFVAGYIIDSLVIGKYKFKNDYKRKYGAFIIKLTSEGKVLWVKATSVEKEKFEISDFRFYSFSGPHIHAIRPDKSGNLYFVGHFSGHGSLDTFNIFTSKNFNNWQTGFNETYYLGKLDKNGQILWITNENSPDRSGADKLILDSLNNIYIDAENYSGGIIQKYSYDGHFIGSIKKYNRDQIAISKEGNIFLSNLGILNSNKDTLFNFKGKFSSFPAKFATSDNSNNIYMKSILFSKWDTAKIEGYKINGPAVIYAILHFPVFNASPKIEETNPPDLQTDDSPVNTEFKIYPNPATDFVNIELFSEEKEQVQTEIIDMYGKTVSYTAATKSEGNYKFGLQLHKFRAGMYIFRVKVGEKLYIKKLVKL